MRDTQGADLCRRLLSEDPQAWEQLVREYSALLLEVSRRTFAAYGFQASIQDREDAVAAVWKNLLDSERRVIRQCLARGNLPQTLIVLTRHRTIDAMRRHKPTAPLPADDDLPELVESVDKGREAIPPEVGAQALSTLSDRERTCIQLFFLQRKRYREIEHLTGIPRNSIGPTLARALEKLRLFLSRPAASVTEPR